jgi:hypothetical protein
MSTTLSGAIRSKSNPGADLPAGWILHRSLDSNSEWVELWENTKTGEKRSKPPFSVKRSKSIPRTAAGASVIRSAATGPAYNPADPTYLRHEIGRLASRGEDMSLREQRNLGELRKQLSQVNEAQRAKIDSEYRTTMEKARAFQAKDPASIDTTTATHDEIRSASLQLLDRWEASPAQKDHIDALLRSDNPQESSAVDRYMLLTTTRSYRSAYAKKLKGWNVLSPAEQVAVAKVMDDGEVRAASLSGSFGLAVPADINPVIMETSAELATIASLATQVTTVSDTWKGITAAASPFTFQPEGSVVADETPTLAQPIVPINTARSYIPASDEVSLDYPEFEANFAATAARLRRPDAERVRRGDRER